MEAGVNRPEIERLIKKYKRMRHAAHFEMPVFAEKTACGTACCIAGQELIDNGYKPIFVAEYDYEAKRNAIVAFEFLSPKKRRVHAFNAARGLLKLTDEQAYRLFQKAEWPYDLQCQPDSPKLAAERLQRFLDTDGRE